MFITAARPKLVSFPPMIKIPVHEEAGWSTPSTPDAVDEVKTRLEASSSRTPRSPEELRDAENQARRLHEAHVAAVAARAARESARAAEAKQRRLRMDEAAKASLKERENDRARRGDRLTAERAKIILQRQQKREAYANAVREARAARDDEREARGEAELERLKDAAQKRGKTIQTMVDKNSHAVKHALAVAAAVKEQQRETAVFAGAKLSERLEAAEERRSQEVAALRAKLQEREVEWARQIAAVLGSHAVDVAQRKRLLELGLMRAALKRKLLLTHVRRRAAAASEKVADAAEAKATAEENEMKEARKEYFAKMNDAAVRRANYRRSLKPPAVIEFEFRNAFGPPAPTKLIERISLKRELAITPTARHARAAANLKKLHKKWAAKCARFALRRMAAQTYHQTAMVIKREELDTRMCAAADARQRHINARRETSIAFNRRVVDAKRRRAAVEGAYRRHIAREGLRKGLATGRRAVLVLTSLPTQQRELAASARRTKAMLLKVKRAAELGERSIAATIRRELLLQERVQKALCNQMARDITVKLTKIYAGPAETANEEQKAEPEEVAPIDGEDFDLVEAKDAQPLSFFI